MAEGEEQLRARLVAVTQRWQKLYGRKGARVGD